MPSAASNRGKRKQHTRDDRGLAGVGRRRYACFVRPNVRRRRRRGDSGVTRARRVSGVFVTLESWHTHAHIHAHIHASISVLRTTSAGVRRWGPIAAFEFWHVD